MISPLPGGDIPAPPPPWERSHETQGASQDSLAALLVAADERLNKRPSRVDLVYGDAATFLEGYDHTKPSYAGEEPKRTANFTGIFQGRQVEAQVFKVPVQDQSAVEPGILLIELEPTEREPGESYVDSMRVFSVESRSDGTLVGWKSLPFDREVVAKKVEAQFREDPDSADLFKEPIVDEQDSLSEVGQLDLPSLNGKIQDFVNLWERRSALIGDAVDAEELKTVKEQRAHGIGLLEEEEVRELIGFINSSKQGRTYEKSMRIQARKDRIKGLSKFVVGLIGRK